MGPCFSFDVPLPVPTEIYRRPPLHRQMRHALCLLAIGDTAVSGIATTFNVPSFAGLYCKAPEETGGTDHARHARPDAGELHRLVTRLAASGRRPGLFGGCL